MATVSASGLVAAVAFGSTTITGAYQGAIGTLAVSVVNPAATQTVSACGSISLPGTYVLVGDLPANPGTGSCLTISNVSAVHFDCQNHILPGVNLANVTTVTVTNCSVDNITGSNLTDVTVDGCSVSSVNLSGSARLTLSSNHVQLGGIRLTSATAALVTSNVVENVNASALDGIRLSGGQNNQVTGNTVDGGYDGSAAAIGLDDGILLISESGDLVQGNTVRRCYTAGVESVDALSNTTIADNTFVMIGTSAVASYWCTNWTTNVVRDNSISSSPVLLTAEFEVGTAQCGNAAVPVGFSGNQIVGNLFRSPIIGRGPAMFVARLEVALSSAPKGAVQSNLIQNNDFGMEDGPFVVPLSGFVNGGGNICGPPTDGVSNMSCSGGGNSVRPRTW